MLGFVLHMSASCLKVQGTIRFDCVYFFDCLKVCEKFSPKAGGLAIRLVLPPHVETLVLWQIFISPAELAFQSVDFSAKSRA